MKDWLDESDAEVGRLLLRAGRGDEPAAVKRRVLAAATSALAGSLAVGSAAASAGGAAVAGGAGTAAKAAGTGAVVAGSAAAKAVSTGVTIASLKWLLVAGAVGVMATAGTVGIQRAVTARRASSPLGTIAASSPPVAAAPVRAVLPAASALAPPPAPTPASPPLADAVPAPSALAASPSVARRPVPQSPAPPARDPAPAPASSSFRDEIAALDGVRASIDSGDPATALADLDRYAARFPHGAMGPEATLLRIEALLRAGERDAAVRVADDFTARQPKSPYASRLRSLLDPPSSPNR